jgi:hypothetical protein
VGALIDALAASMGEESAVERTVFATSDPAVVAGHIDAFCGERLGASVVSCLFYASSTGCVAGVVLADGRHVVVKAYQSRWGEPFLLAVAGVQGYLARSDFPCPRPLAPVSVAGPALATAEELVPDPGLRPLTSTSDRRASARGLARLIGLCRPLDEPDLAAHPLRSPGGALYPEPHSPLFDFALEAASAQWIDELATMAVAARDADGSDPVIGHSDWSSRNIRVGRGELCIAYDWDSLTLATESALVGQAAATWRSFGDDRPSVAPGVEEVRSYVADYEAASGRRFDRGRRRAALAAALWVLAYTARCEHALEARTGLRVEHARTRLIADGWSFLAPGAVG